jgi:DNA-binding LytR/AlgR family response regulator
MQIVVKEPVAGEEESVVITVKGMPDHVLKAIQILKAAGEKLTVYQEEEVFFLEIRKIFYVESIDLKTFVYGEKGVYQSKMKLYEIEQTLDQGDFLRISKQVLVNVKKIRSLATAGAGRFQATLQNGEKVIISRQYVPALKERFGL